MRIPVFFYFLFVENFGECVKCVCCVVADFFVCLFFFCLAVYDGSFEAGVVFDLDIVSFLSCVDARLFCDAFIGRVCVCLSFSSAYADGASRCVADGQAGGFACFFVVLLILFAFYREVVSCFTPIFILFMKIYTSSQM